MLDTIVRELGFKDEEDFHHLVASINMTPPEKVATFKKWQFDDGTKNGRLD